MALKSGDKINFRRLEAAVRRFLFELKRDKAVSDALLAVLIIASLALGIWFVGDRFLLRPKEVKRLSLERACSRLQAELSAPLPLADLERLREEKERLEQELKVLESKRFFLEQDLRARTDPIRFQRTVLGFVPGAPFPLKTSLIKSSFSGPRALVRGRLPYLDLLQYLDYLEHELSVAFMDDFSVSETGCDQDQGKEALLCFSITLASSAPGQEKGGKAGGK